MSNIKQTRISLRKGLKSDLPSHAPLGEPLYCIDTNELYVGMGDSEKIKLLSSIDTLRGFVTYKQFGCKLDGVTDDSDNIIRCHKFANEHGLKVIQNNVKFVLNKSVEVKTDVDLTGCTCFTSMRGVDNSSDRNNHLYIITSDEQEKLVPYVGELVKDSMILNVSSDYNGPIFISSTENYMNRVDGGVTSSVKKSEPNYVFDGKLKYPLIHTYDTSQTKIYCKLNEGTVNFKAPLFIVNSTTRIGSLIRVLRNNVNVSNVQLKEDNTCGDIAPVYTLLSTYRINNININNFDCDRIGRTSKQGLQSLGYYVLFEMTSNIDVGNCTQGHNSWSGINGNYFRDMRVKDCSLMSVSGHAFMSDVYIDRCTIYNGNYIMGTGVYQVRDSTFLDSCSFCITTRSDYSGEFLGDIKLYNVKSYAKNCVIQFPVAYHDNGIIPRLPNVYINGLEIYSKSDFNYIINYIKYEDLKTSVYLPDRIDLIDVSINTSNLHNNIGFGFPIDSKILNKKLVVNIDRMHIVDENYRVPNDRVWLGERSNVITPIITGNTKLEYNILNSTTNIGIIGTNNITINCNNVKLTVFRKLNTASNFSGECLVNFDNCVFFRPYCYIPQNVKISCSNSKFVKFTKVDGSKDDNIGAGFASNVILSRGNVSEPNAIITSEDKKKLYNYIDTQYWTNTSE